MQFEVILIPGYVRPNVATVCLDSDIGLSRAASSPCNLSKIIDQMLAFLSKRELSTDA